MPNCDFYAAGADYGRILDFVFDQPGWLLVESASRDDMPPRRFRSTDEVLQAFDLDRIAANLHLYAPGHLGMIVEDPVVYRPGAVSGATGRSDVRGWGLIQLHLAAAGSDVIGVSHTNHNSRSRAASWQSAYGDLLGSVDAWDWEAVTRTSRRLNYRIRKLGVERAGSRVILPDAAARVAQGAHLSLN